MTTGQTWLSHCGLEHGERWVSGACACVSAGGGGSGRDDKEKETEIHRLTYGKDGMLSVVELLAYKWLRDMLVYIRGWTEAATEANDKLMIKDIKCRLNKLTRANNHAHHSSHHSQETLKLIFKNYAKN